MLLTPTSVPVVVCEHSQGIGRRECVLICHRHQQEVCGLLSDWEAGQDLYHLSVSPHGNGEFQFTTANCSDKWGLGVSYCRYYL